MPKNQYSSKKAKKPQAPVAAVAPKAFPYKWLVAACVAVVVIGGAIGWYYHARNHTDSASAPLSQALPTAPASHPSPLASPEGSLTAQDATWSLYSNPVWGFSLKVPTSATEYGCFKGPSGNYSLAESQSAPITVLESTTDLYLTVSQAAYLYGDNQCGTRPTTLAILSTPDELQHTQLPSYDIKRQTVKDGGQLTDFVKQTYGSGCTFTRKTSSQTGVDDVTLIGDGKPLDTTTCDNDTLVIIKYLVARNEVIYWDMGQEARFMSDSSGSTVYDNDILASFKAL